MAKKKHIQTLVDFFEMFFSVDSPMTALAPGRELIPDPDLLQQMHRHPPLTEQEVVEVAEGMQVVFAEHWHEIDPKLLST